MTIRHAVVFYTCAHARARGIVLMHNHMAQKNENTRKVLFIGKHQIFNLSVYELIVKANEKYKNDKHKYD